MSSSASRLSRTRTAIAARYDVAEAHQDILDFLGGCYDAPLAPLLTEKQLSQRRMLRWMRNRHDKMALFGLVESRRTLPAGAVDYLGRNIANDGAEYPHYFLGSLLAIGVDTPAKGNRFVDLYEQVQDPGRSWVSGCQVDQLRAAAIALTPNYNRLPNWVRQGLMNAPSAAKIGGDRIGDIWRLIPCVKAWNWAPFSKRIAEKIGKCSPKFRMLAAIAWEARTSYGKDMTDVESFWAILHWLQSASLMEQIDFAMNGAVVDYHYGKPGYSVVQWGRTRWAAFLTESLGLPWGLIELPKRVTAEAITEAITRLGSPRQACLALFGVAGKATERAFSSATKESWQWASALAYGNADAVQKILSMETLIEWEPEAVDFLKSLPMVSRLRMLQATEFKYRGEVCPISADHVRDTGYLWANIQTKPNLGRVRCWFSCHEQLAAAFVAELPDEALPIPAGWDRVDGLCAVDGTWELEFPQRVATLKYWGQILRNCVGGYGPAIKSGRSVIFAVRQQGQITHCVEFAGGHCNQFYRAGNRSPDYDVKDAVLAALGLAGLA